jgi:hypothetical protein
VTTYEVVGVKGRHVEVGVPERGPVAATLGEDAVLVQPHAGHAQQLRRHVAEPAHNMAIMGC